jgi:hypothetical protein
MFSRVLVRAAPRAAARCVARPTLLHLPATVAAQPAPARAFHCIALLHSDIMVDVVPSLRQKAEMGFDADTEKMPAWMTPPSLLGQSKDRAARRKVESTCKDSDSNLCNSSTSYSLFPLSLADSPVFKPRELVETRIRELPHTFAAFSMFEHVLICISLAVRLTYLLSRLLLVCRRTFVQAVRGQTAGLLRVQH